MLRFNPTPNVHSKYGAPMGRNSFQAKTLQGKCHMVRVPLDSGGYDRGGAYWGIGAPLFYVEDSNGNYLYTRGTDRSAVKKALAHLRWYR